MRTREFAPLDESDSRLVLSLLERVLDVPGAERREWLDQHCGGRERVLSEVWRPGEG